MNEEARRRIAGSKRGKPRSEETKAKIAAAMRGRQQSPETRALISAKLKYRGKGHSIRRKISAAHLARQPLTGAARLAPHSKNRDRNANHRTYRTYLMEAVARGSTIILATDKDWSDIWKFYRESPPYSHCDAPEHLTISFHRSSPAATLWGWKKIKGNRQPLGCARGKVRLGAHWMEAWQDQVTFQTPDGTNHRFECFIAFHPPETP